MNKFLAFLNWTILVLFIFSTNAVSKVNSLEDDPENKNSEIKDSLKTFEFPQIDVIGRSPSGIYNLPGSGNTINEEELKLIAPITGNEVLRRITGVNTIDEEGVGLRLNAGIRGLDPDRSRTVLVLEDGVPIALAPYGEPEMYYTPPIDRMSGIQVLKGSGSILFGPRTVGGIINYITADPPAEEEMHLKIRGGQDGYFTGIFSYGTSINNTGLLVNYMNKRADNLGITRFRINDLTGKLKFELSEKSTVGLKLGVYDETSNSTYVGLTQTMYDAGDNFVRIAPDDKLDVQRFSASITHEYNINNNFTIKTTAFGYTTTRNWLRQDFSRTSPSNPTGVIFGDTTVPGGAIYMRNSTGNRDRQFEVIGIEPRIYSDFMLGKNVSGTFEGGVRVLYEKAFEQRINGKKADVQSGNLKNDETRTGYAYTIFAQNRFTFNNRFNITPGVRAEFFDYERDIYRKNYIDTSITNNSNISEIIPGLGINYNAGNRYSFFAGVHRGFAPPRIKDAVSSNGEALQLDAELSWNYEAGVRLSPIPFLSLELTGYYLDFSNQIIPVSESSGGTGTGLVNGGATKHLGIENALSFDIAKSLGANFSVLASLNLSLNKSEFSQDQFISNGDSSVNINGNKLPYSPELIMTNSIEFIMLNGFAMQITGNYTGKQFTDELNTVTPDPNGLDGELSSYYIMDATARYYSDKLNSTFTISVKNLLNERYIASRRPQGIKVGLPRFFSAGIDIGL